MLKRILYSTGVVTLSILLLTGGAAANAQAAKSPQWVGTWATAPMAAGPIAATGGFSVHPFASTTLREIVHISNGGQQIRIRFTNDFGVDPLTINDVHVAVSAGGGAVAPGTDHPVTFGGAVTGRIPPGAALYSDPINFSVQPLSDLAVSFYIPSQIMRSETYHESAFQDNYLVDGDQAAAPSINRATTINSWYFLDGIDVAAASGARAIVTMGDSITDGAHSTLNANRRWPDVLAMRLKQEHGLEQVAVLNEGIDGNRVLNDGAGPNALARFDRDVLAQNGARYLIVLESINDIGRFGTPRAPEDRVTAEQLEQGLKQIVDAAHEHGIKAYGATLTPYGGAGYSSAAGETAREALNDWIRTSGIFDGVIDFDQITRDPANPTRFNPLYDSGDHLHPSDAGYKAMGERIDLKLFR